MSCYAVYKPLIMWSLPHSKSEKIIPSCNTATWAVKKPKKRLSTHWKIGIWAVQPWLKHVKLGFMLKSGSVLRDFGPFPSNNGLLLRWWSPSMKELRDVLIHCVDLMFQHLWDQSIHCHQQFTSRRNPDLQSDCNKKAFGQHVIGIAW